jgi:hypothetical protein
MKRNTTSSRGQPSRTFSRYPPSVCPLRAELVAAEEDVFLPQRFLGIPMQLGSRNKAAQEPLCLNAPDLIRREGPEDGVLCEENGKRTKRWSEQ